MMQSKLINKDLPQEYNSLMYLKGYSPEQILMTAHRTFIQEAEERQEEEDIGNIHITSEVKVK